ncbi:MULTISPECIES: protein kinase [unclassified Streptomyces]|uniref:serine/threonine-protein kinase n=1 Tax=unclassified Streptomyces TaxID=2593676 RepID=UPI00070904B1|nr:MULTISPECIES: serine/threonine-protein kinase [unclassified Streptomyces]KRD21032.1 Tat pathway signal protein [Streptomyces sp. Root264]
MQPLRPEDPEQLGPYRLVARLGAGGMGRVYLARSSAGRVVAVKVIRPEMADDDNFRIRFRREVAAAAAVGGPYTAHVVDAAPDDETPWLATDHVPGPTLAEAVAAHGPLPVETVLALGAGIAEALTAVHAEGLVHRDLKPSNVLLAADGPRVIDFGIVRARDGYELTGSGTLFGSLDYMCPEQATGDPMGPEGDVFCLGSVLAFAASGRSPFGGAVGAAQLYQVAHGSPDLSLVPEPLDKIISLCHAKDPVLRIHPDRLSAACAPGGAEQVLTEGWLPAPVSAMVDAHRAAVRDLDRLAPPDRVPGPGAFAPPLREPAAEPVVGPPEPAGRRPAHPTVDRPKCGAPESESESESDTETGAGVGGDGEGRSGSGSGSGYGNRGRGEGTGAVGGARPSAVLPGAESFASPDEPDRARPRARTLTRAGSRAGARAQSQARAQAEAPARAETQAEVLSADQAEDRSEARAQAPEPAKGRTPAPGSTLAKKLTGLQAVRDTLPQTASKRSAAPAHHRAPARSGVARRTVLAATAGVALVGGAALAVRGTPGAQTARPLGRAPEPTWVYRGGPLLQAPAVFHDGTALLKTRPGDMIGLDVRNGSRPRWVYQGISLSPGPVLLIHGAAVALGAGATVIGVDPVGGAEQFTLDFGEDYRFDQLLGGYDDHSVSVLGAKLQRRPGEQGVATSTDSVFSVDIEARQALVIPIDPQDVGIALQPVITDEYFVYADGLRNVAVRGTRDGGSLRWRHQVGYDLRPGLAVLGQTVFAIGSELIALELATGRLRWNAKAERGTYASLGAVGNTVYVTSTDPCGVHAFDAASGSRRWFCETPRLDMDSPVAVGAHAVYVTAFENKHGFYAIDTASGRLLWNFTDGRETGVNRWQLSCDGAGHLVAQHFDRVYGLPVT